MAIFLALLSALLGGSADFLGGTAARQLSAFRVVGLSQAGALLVAVLLVLVTGSSQGDLAHAAAWGVPAGVAMLVGLVSFYGALAKGTMGIVAPIAALGVVVPVLWGLSKGEAPAAVQVAGMAVAVVGVVLSSGPHWGDSASRLPIMLAVSAAAGFGSSMLFFAEGSQGNPMLALLLMKITIVVLLVGTLRPVTRSPDQQGRGGLWGMLLMIAFADIGANVSFAYASRMGLLSLVAVLGSLYPVATVLLARWIHSERVTRIQQVGVIAALAGVVLIGSG
jgi:drug/metabolite transporter (DMT)-like permease